MCFYFHRLTRNFYAIKLYPNASFTLPKASSHKGEPDRWVCGHILFNWCNSLAFRKQYQKGRGYLFQKGRNTNSSVLVERPHDPKYKAQNRQGRLTFRRYLSCGAVLDWVFWLICRSIEYGRFLRTFWKRYPRPNDPMMFFSNLNCYQLVNFSHIILDNVLMLNDKRLR